MAMSMFLSALLCTDYSSRFCQLTEKGRTAQYYFVIDRMAPEARGAPFSRRFTALFGAAALAAAIAASAYPPNAKAAELVPWTNGALPLPTLPALGGVSTALSEQRGEALLVHFFATWCEPCRDELPALKRLSERSGPALKIVAISVGEPGSRVQRIVQPMSLDFPVLLDSDRALTKAWQVSSLPTTFVLDSRLKPRLVVEADHAWDSVDPKQLIESLSQSGRPNQQHAHKEGHDDELR